MSARLAAVTLLIASLQSCTGAPSPAAPAGLPASRPLDVDPGGDDLALVREDLIATASARYGQEALNQALAAEAYLIVKRFAGMAPPPPAGAGPDWVAPTPSALLMKRSGGWFVATGNGWRPAKQDASATVDGVVADPRFWGEPAFIPPCPDYGASLLLLKIAGRAETARKSSCTSVADKAVFAALQA